MKEYKRFPHDFKIMNTIKSFLKKWPLFYYLLQKVYYRFRQVVETSILGTKVQEWIWKTQDIPKDFTKGYWESVQHPHRKLLIDKISSYSPIDSILEIGCNAGPNLYLLSKKFPNARIYGIDINSQAIKEGKKQFAQMGINNISLDTGRADKLELFKDKSIDVVFTDAILMYVGPDKIKGVISEIIRISRKGAIFVEWDMCKNDLATPDEHLYHYGHWVHDFRSLLAKYISPDKVRVTKIPEGIWDRAWEKFGSIIEVEL